MSARRGVGFDQVVAEAWCRYEGNLAAYVASLPEGSYVTITSAQASAGQRGQRPYVDLVSVDDNLIIGVASLPTYLYPGSVESASADRRLHGLGWSEPGIPTVDGTVMDYVIDSARDEADLLAVVTVATFREVWNVPHPSFLSAWAVGGDDSSNGPVALSQHPASVDQPRCADDDRTVTSDSASTLWMQQARSWTNAADSLLRARSEFRNAASGQDRPAKSTGS